MNSKCLKCGSVSPLPTYNVEQLKQNIDTLLFRIGFGTRFKRIVCPTCLARETNWKEGG